VTFDTTILIVFTAAVFVSFAAGAAVRLGAARLGAVVAPRPDRWHRQPTPTFGGIAIGIGTLAGLVLSGEISGPALPILAVAGALFVIGWYDDVSPMSALAKMVSSLAVAAFFVVTLTTFKATPWHAGLILLAVIWFGFLDNAINLLDNMDGLAAGVSALAALALVATFWDDLGPASWVLLALAGGLVGFLGWNRHPARLFMGNCGSLAVGGVLAAAGTLAVARTGSVTSAAAVGLILIVPIFDTTFVVLLRRLAGRSTTRGNIDHTSHRLVSAGFSEPKAVALHYALGLGGATAGYLLHVNGPSIWPLAVIFGVGVLMLGLYLARVPAYGGQDFQNVPFAPLLADLTFRWHAGQVLLDLLLIATCYYGAYRIRFDGEALANFLPSFSASLPAILGCQLAGLYMSGLYSRLWSTCGLHDLSTVVRGVATGLVLSVLSVTYVYKFERFSRSVFMIDAVLLAVAIVATRSSFRIMGRVAARNSPRKRRVAIYGAGVRGQMLAREMQANPTWERNAVAFVDDDRMKRSQRIVGIPVHGALDDLERLIGSLGIEEVLISSPSINGTVEARVRELCGGLEVPVRRLYLEIR
jgi:UDP-GlcNAc:undecaprenyl-phosphate GlcNAc-1-phosphate transferase